MNPKSSDPASVAKGQGHFDSEFHRLQHVLRNPLNALNGFAELLLMDEGLSPASAGYVRAIVSSSQTLTQALVAHLDDTQEQGRAVIAPRHFHRQERIVTP